MQHSFKWLGKYIKQCVRLQTSRPGFFRQNSGRSFKLLDLRRSNQSTHSTSSGSVSSPPQLSPPSTPTGSEHASWDPYSRTCRRIPTVSAYFRAVCVFFIQNPQTRFYLGFILQPYKHLFTLRCFFPTGRTKNQQHLWGSDREETSTKDLSLRWDKLRERWWCWHDGHPEEIKLYSMYFLMPII